MNTPVAAEGSSDGRILQQLVDVTAAEGQAQTHRNPSALRAIASKAGRIGGWFVDLSTNLVEWSDESPRS
ncbi:MAG: hypothetical protein U5Q44_13870 [Dehalococcoidia bacterium]|nr:hypothetical protein [Dehalococcoidia bacterium]